MLTYSCINNCYYLDEKKIKYLHPSGQTEMVSGHGIQKSGFLRESTVNSNKITKIEGCKTIIIYPNHIDSTGIKGLFFGYFIDSKLNEYGKNSICKIIKINRG